MPYLSSYELTIVSAHFSNRLSTSFATRCELACPVQKSVHQTVLCVRVGQTDRQTDRQTGRQAVRQADRQKDELQKVLYLTNKCTLNPYQSTGLYGS